MAISAINEIQESDILTETVPVRKESITFLDKVITPKRVPLPIEFVFGVYKQCLAYYQKMPQGGTAANEDVLKFNFPEPFETFEDEQKFVRLICKYLDIPKELANLEDGLLISLLEFPRLLADLSPYFPGRVKQGEFLNEIQELAKFSDALMTTDAPTGEQKTPPTKKKDKYSDYASYYVSKEDEEADAKEWQEQQKRDRKEELIKELMELSPEFAEEQKKRQETELLNELKRLDELEN